MPRAGQLKSILQILPEKTAGNFNVWYWSAGRIQQLLLTIKRRYYCNGKGLKKGADGHESKGLKITKQRLLLELKKNDIEMYKQYQKFIKLELKASNKGYKKGWGVHQLKEDKEIIDYGKFKGYHHKWAQYRIEQRGEQNTSNDGSMVQ